MKYPPGPMKNSLKIRFFAVLLGALFAVGAIAQDTDEKAALEAPDLSSLESGWWSYFQHSGDNAKSRVDEFLADVGEQIAALQAPNQAVGQSVLEAVSDNLNAYIALLDERELNPQTLAEPALSYSIDELLELADEARGAAAAAALEQFEVEREQRILDGASRRRDLAFKGYVNAAAGDENLLTALRLIQNRSAQAIAARRLELLTQRFDRASTYAEATATRVDYAAERLSTTPETAGLRRTLRASTRALVSSSCLSCTL